MKIYDAERKLNLADAISNASVASANYAMLDSSQAEKIYKGEYAKQEKEFDLEMLPADCSMAAFVLVSTNWNKNDDVFTPDETAKAIHTPRMKPVNMMHQGREASGQNTTIGVMVDAFAVNDDYERVYSDSEEMKDFFHIVGRAILWKRYFPTAVGQVEEAIKNDKAFVSMECFFDDFGYALQKEGEDKIDLLQRNDITAWLSQYLRVLGGSGEVEINGSKYKIGRWLRSIIFSGVAFVDNPANPESIVFEDYLTHASVRYEHIDETDIVTKEQDLDNNEKSGVLFYRSTAQWPMTKDM